MIIQFAVRTIGPILLRGGLGGGAASTTNTATSSAKDDDFDDFDDETNEVVDKNKSKVSVSLPTFAPDSSEETFADSSPAAVSTSNTPARIDLFDSFNDDSSSSTQTPTLSVR